MSVELTFGQVEAICASLNRIASDKRVAFTGRLKQLQKAGLCGTRPGRGRIGAYSFGDAMRFVVAVELMQAGMMPQMCSKLVTGNWDTLRTTIYTCTFAPEDTIGFVSKPTEFLWMLAPEALRALTVDGESEHDHWDRFSILPVAQAAHYLTKGVDPHPQFHGESWRTIVINAYNLTQAVMKLIAYQFKYATRLEMREDLGVEIEQFSEDARAFSKMLDDMPPLPPEKAQEIARRMRDLDNWDFSTSPPTPTSVLDERARELLPVLSSQVREYLGSMSLGESHGISDELLQELLAIDLIEIGDVPTSDGDREVGVTVTPFGKAVLRLLNPPLAAEMDALAAMPDPIRVEAARLLKKLTEAQKASIADRDTNKFDEPYHSEMKALGIIEEVPADPPYPRGVRFTELGQQVFSLLKHPHRLPTSEQMEAHDGDR